MLVADTVRCPWHHACFSLRTGEALRAPALDPVACWRVDQQDGKIYVRDKLEPAERGARTATGAGPDSIVIIGGGAAGNAAAEMLRREGYSGPVTMLSADDAGPYPICPRTTWPATRPRNGFRCGRPISTASMGSS